MSWGRDVWGGAIGSTPQLVNYSVKVRDIMLPGAQTQQDKPIYTLLEYNEWVYIDALSSALLAALRMR